MYKRGAVGLKKEIFQTIITAVILLPFVTKPFETIKTQFAAYEAALDIYYFQRIFSIDDNFLQLGNMYVDSENYQYRQTNNLSLGELLQKSFFHLLDKNVIATYYLFSLLILFLWLVLITRLTVEKVKISRIKSLVLTSILFISFFGYNNVLNTNYSFARILSPQISVLLWLVGLKLISKIIATRNSEKPKLWHLSFFHLLILVSSFTYLYTFMSLIAVNLILLTIYTVKKDFVSLIWSIFLTLMSSLPFIFLNYSKSNEERFKDAGERMGLIDYHFFGSIQTVLICLGICLFIVAHCRFLRVKHQCSNLEFVLLISSSGILFASQSNVITGREIQFYHFDLFAKTNLMIYLLLLLSRVKLVGNRYQLTLYRTPIVGLLSGILILNSIFSIFRPVLSNSESLSETKFTINRYTERDRLIVDVANLQNAFPVYSKAKLLYQSDITTYGFTNREVLARAFISSGCPNQLSKEFKSEIEVYRAVAIYQKAIALKKFMDYLKVNFILSSLYESTLESAYRERSEIKSEIDEFLMSVSEFSCIALAKSYGIDYVIFDNYSGWQSIAKNNDLLVNSLKLKGIDLYEIRI